MSPESPLARHVRAAAHRILADLAPDPTASEHIYEILIDDHWQLSIRLEPLPWPTQGKVDTEPLGQLLGELQRRTDGHRPGHGGDAEVLAQEDAADHTQVIDQRRERGVQSARRECGAGKGDSAKSDQSEVAGPPSRSVRPTGSLPGTAAPASSSSAIFLGTVDMRLLFAHAYTEDRTLPVGLGSVRLAGLNDLLSRVFPGCIGSRVPASGGHPDGARREAGCCGPAVGRVRR